jgi:hypothetical protein
MQKRIATLLLLSLVLLTPVTSEGAIKAAEYFIDHDPGQGSGTPIEVDPTAQAADIQVQVPASVIEALSPGTHILACRVQDETGNWSIAFSRPFFKEYSPALVPSRVVAAEYYIDEDPGQGNGIPVEVGTIRRAADIQVQVPPKVIEALSPGNHILACRVKDEAGNWSIAFSRPFFKEYSGAVEPSAIVAVEYMFDADRGPGMGQVVRIPNPSARMNGAVSVPPQVIGALADGLHAVAVRVQDENGNWSVAVTRTFFKETVPDVAPTITRQPADQTVNPGVSVTFSVVATGTEPLAYQWRKGGVNIPNATSSSLTIGAVQFSDEGIYSVVVRNGGGQVTSAGARLTVNVPPSVTTQPITQTLGSGSEAIFTVTASGTPPFTYQWKKDGEDLPGETGASLRLSNVEASNIGQYSVTIRNVAGEVTSQGASLSVLDLQMYPGLTIYGRVGARYKIEYVDNVDAPKWIELTEIILPGSPHTYSDYTAPRGFRFYRATLVP